MTLPSMDSSNMVARLQQSIVTLAATVDQIRSSLGLFENATVGKGGLTLRDGGRILMLDTEGREVGAMYVGGLDIIDRTTGGAMSLFRGTLKLWDDFTGNPTNFGRITTDQGAGTNVLRMLPPFSDGTGNENSITVQGRRPGQPGAAWLRSDGTVQVTADVLTSVAAPEIRLTTPQLSLYNLPSTSGTGNLRLATIGGVWTVGFISSSRRFKLDIEDAVVDPADVLQLRPRTWRDLTEVEADPDSTMRFVGFIAEELDEHPTLRQFVEYDDEDRPAAIAYDRLAAGLVVLAQHQEQRLADLELQVAALVDANAALAHRLEALEA